MTYDLSGKDVLVTGATGFIGRRLIEALAGRGARVRAMARNPAKAEGLAARGFRVVAGDMTDAASLRAALPGARAVVHLAGAVNDFRPLSWYREVNVEGTRVLAEAAAAAGVERFVHVSTVWVHGLWCGPGVTEAAPRRRSGHSYCDTKLEGEEAALAVGRDTGLPVIVLQPSEVYGPGDPFWTNRSLELLRSRKMLLVDRGEGLIHPVFIDDLVEGMVAAAERGRPGETYILCGPTSTTFRDFFRRLASIVGRRRIPSVPAGLALAMTGVAEAAARRFGTRPFALRQEVLASTARATYDGGKASRELGFTARTGLDEGMRRVGDWWEAGRPDVFGGPARGRA